MIARNWPGITVPLTPSIIVFGSVRAPRGLHLPVGGIAVITIFYQLS